ncbi:hypothetical protein MJO28_002533 [Puccinia striiformis f. sp. tritici]|uniref:Obg family GTPase CgtA n=4 Tax=Puccinia striiformis TaxID=27350 RepID=A0A0L0UZ03_9BASI|nr:hypothetical protein Pst134EA_005503 [Puccinia striiformis f. sp. tritici]KAI9628613.1 hypothetical protein KEM48_011569 [Puccinia striiformis f. sp. tritici PST-130]KNE92260.1 hypothetical protein PSTG_14354 [Puccinia striiformis f. sp. tritici PST-78]POW08780.1 hypothetical protein PSTT_07267 [Puccinia striiformis]KAH9462705.1 hypothetical protein Pst134EB_006584 [Puccinia striiformis f. sp. tritici]KAH9471614.1 hypothetical protein Pst134EA_005503 [Puccinia striiformis f. sp. tritici]
MIIRKPTRSSYQPFSTLPALYRPPRNPDKHPRTRGTDPQQGDQTEWKSSFDWEAELRRRQRVAKERGRKASKFVDQMKVLVRAGNGGDGGVAFHREKFVARGGPSGGNGGQGGSVYLRPSAEVQSLNRIPRILRGISGTNGGGQWMNGPAGKDLIVDVPIGTVIREIRSNQITEQRESALGFDFGNRLPKASDLVDEDPDIAKARRSKLFVHYPESEDTNQTNEALKNLEISLLQEQWSTEREYSRSEPFEMDCAEFHEEHNKNRTQNEDPSRQVNRSFKSEDDFFLVAKGGEGGLGNANFSGNQTTLPRFATRGKKGQIIELELELKTLADIGLVGFPNSGKSTLIHTLTNSRAEIAPYPFTTLNPQIGTLIIFNDGTWDLDETRSAIDHSPSHKEYLDAKSATDLIRDRSKRQGSSSTGQNLPRKCESMRLTIADCPGLLPKASENVGLGHAFLRHIERSRMLVLVVDLMAGLPISTSSSSHQPKVIEDDNPQRCCEDVETLFNELESYQTGLSSRVGILIANKADLSSDTLNQNLKLIAQVRLQALNDYITSFTQYQIQIGLRAPLPPSSSSSSAVTTIDQNQNQNHSKIIVLPISAKFRLNIKKLVSVIEQFFDHSSSSKS